MQAIGFNDFITTAVSYNCLIFRFEKGEIKILLVKSDMKPFENLWAIPGDLVFPSEESIDAVKRVLMELTGLSNIKIYKSNIFGGKQRHPQGRVITEAFYTLFRITDFDLQSSSWSDKAIWLSIHQVEKLAFDHNLILTTTYDLLKQKLSTEPICFDLLPEKFTLLELQKLYEYAFETKYDAANFRKKIKTIPLIELNEIETNVNHRPAKLYSFDSISFNNIISNNGIYKFKI
jgi:8-oxo-dGTP diphosphatase